MKPLSLPAAVVGAATLAATVLTAPAAAAAPQASTAPTSTCRSVLLPTLGGDGDTQLSGGDPSGRYLLGNVVDFDRSTYQITYTPVMWTGGRIHALDLTPLQPAVEAILVDANRRGVVAGERMTDFNSFHTDAFTYRAGRYTWLPPLNPGDGTTVTGINDRGDVVGYDQDQQTPSVQYHAVVWPAGHPGTVRELSLPGQQTTNFSALGIDEDGTVLVEEGNEPGAIPYIWPAHGAPYQLAAPAGTSGPPVATAIRDGWVVGTAYQADGQAFGVRWNLRTHRAEVVSTEYPSFQAVNSRGEIAAAGAMIHRDGRAVPLDPTAFTPPFPQLLTDSGMVAGNPAEFGGPATVWLGC